MIPRDKNEVGYAGGTFDLFHAGHVEFLRLCKQRCKFLVVSVNTDEFAERYKRKPIMTLEERMTVLKACKYVDGVIVNIGDEDSTIAMEVLNIGMVYHGDEWERESLLKQMGIHESWLAVRGIELIQVPYTSGISTSDIISRCQASQPS